MEVTACVWCVDTQYKQKKSGTYSRKGQVGFG